MALADKEGRPEDDGRGPQEFSEAHRAGLDTRRTDQDRTLAAVNQLEASLEEAAPRREDDWRVEVAAALATLVEVTGAEADNAEQPDSLLSDIARTQPWLRNRVRGLRLQYRHLRETLAALSQELESHPDAAVDYADLRQRLGWALTALRHQRARESDLIYEAYYEAFGADLSGEANEGHPIATSRPIDGPAGRPPPTAAPTSKKGD
jgi:chromosome segregation ATPase